MALGGIAQQHGTMEMMPLKAIAQLYPNICFYFLIVGKAMDFRLDHGARISSKLEDATEKLSILNDKGWRDA